MSDPDKPDNVSAFPAKPDLTAQMLEAAEREVPPEPEQPPAASVAALPSEFQDAARNAITVVQIERDKLQAQHERWTAELEGAERSYASSREEHELQFMTEKNRREVAFAEAQEKLRSLISNCGLGIAALEKSITAYNEAIAANVRTE